MTEGDSSVYLVKQSYYHHHHFWQAPLRVRSDKHRHEPPSPQWTIL